MNYEVLTPVLMGQVRHLLSVAAGAAVAHGLISGGTAESLVAVGVYVATAVWSAYAKKQS